MPLAPVEEKMWQESPSKTRTKMSDSEINQKYESGEQRILTEINREKLPSFVEALKKHGYMDLRPFYQRRDRWDLEKQSRLIESLLINIPVPPIILYEKDYNSYEVMDGQQRISAIRNFYENKLKLTGLELWPELNGRNYADLPVKIRAGIDRRSISSIVIITESASNPEEALLLKQKTFERLNTGGVSLSQQEVRNCLYQGKFNDLLLELAREPIFAKAWGIPTGIYNTESELPKELSENNFYKKMEDYDHCSVVTRLAVAKVEGTKLSVGGKIFLVSEAYCQLARIESIHLNDVGIDELQTTSGMEIGLKFNVDARKDFCLYQVITSELTDI